MAVSQQWCRDFMDAIITQKAGTLATMRHTLLPLLAITSVHVMAAPPVATYMNPPTFDEVKISPNGTYLALTRRVDEHDVLIVLERQGLKAVSQTAFTDLIDISSFQWGKDGRILISPERRFPESIAYKARTGEIIGINVDGKSQELIFGYAAGEVQTGSRIARREGIEAAGELLDVLPGNPESVLVQTKGYAIEGEYNVAYRMNVKTGKLAKLAISPVRNGDFMTDVDHRIALVSGTDSAGDLHIYHRASDASDWREVATRKQFGTGILPVGPAGGGNFLVLDDSDAPTLGVSSWNPLTGERKLLHRVPGADLMPLGSDPSGLPWGFIYIDHYFEYWYPDPEHPLARVHRTLCGMYKESYIYFTSQTDDMKLVVARVSSAGAAPVFLVVDVATGKVLQKLESRPDLKPADMALVEPIEFKSRDGKSIRGYLTTPAGTEKKKLPLVVLVHGGPYGAYDDYGFDPQRQLIASRGYAVLQVNFRGSGGRGQQFESAGYLGWGREMQDDITDGVKWAIQDGVADAARICIYGGSYGAYAALTGAFRDPDLYRCAIGLAGVYDLPLMYDKGDIHLVDSGVNYLKEIVGTDMEELKRRSPVYNADKIRAAVLLLHGKEDRRAPYEHAKRLKAALEKVSHAPEWFSEWGEGHGFRNDQTRTRSYEKILDFLDRNIGNASAGKSR